MDMNSLDSLREEETRQMAALAGIGDSRTQAEMQLLLDAYWKLFLAYTGILRLEVADARTLLQCYRLCLLWTPNLTAEMRQLVGQIYSAVVQHYDKISREAADPAVQADAKVAIARCARIMMAAGVLSRSDCISSIATLAREALGLRPTDAQANCVLGDLFLGQLASEEAASSQVTRQTLMAEVTKYFEAALAIDPACSDALCGLAIARRDNSLFQRAKQSEPANITVATLRG